MQILDTPIAPPKTYPIWNTVLRYGLICGVTFISIAQILYHAGIFMVEPRNVAIALISTLATSTAITIFSVKKQKSMDGGYIPFGKAAVVSSLSIYIGYFILNVWNYIFTKYINPDYIPQLKELTRNVFGSQYSPEQMTRSLANLDDLTNFSLTMRSSFLYESPPGIIVGLIIAAFLSKRFKV